MAKVARHFVGIDLHLRVVQICVLNGDGDIVDEVRQRIQDRASRRRVITYLKRWRRGVFVVEALGLNRWFVNACREAQLKVVIADPLKLGLKVTGKKTDRRDAYELARRLWLGDVEQNASTYYPTEAEYGARRLIRGRHFLVQQRHRVVLQIRSLLRAYGVEEPVGTLRTSKGLEALRRRELPSAELNLLLQTWVTLLERFEASIQVLDRQILSYATEPEVARLSTLPSVGTLTAATLVFELGDISRFKGAREVAAYAGLVPRVTQSGDTARHGKITRRGNRELRWILGQWAIRLLCRDIRVRRWAASRLQRMATNKVRVALARRLLVGVYVALKRNEEFSLERCLTA